MNHRGETALLAAIARPTIGLINNAQREHQEFMRSVADVAQEHASLFATLPERGCAVLNADDDFAPSWRAAAAAANATVFGVQRPRARALLSLLSSDVTLESPRRALLMLLRPATSGTRCRGGGFGCRVDLAYVALSGIRAVKGGSNAHRAPVR
jgi:hypothetical protein